MNDDGAAASLRAAQNELGKARTWTPTPEETVAHLAAHLAGQDETGHGWTVFPAECDDLMALRGMHVAAHANLVEQARDEVRAAALEASGQYPDEEELAAERAYMDMADPHAEDYFDAAYEAWCEQQMTLCGAQFTTGGPDPDDTSCDHGAGHYPHTAHEGPDPLGDGRMSWRGGGLCAGDPLPQTSVTHTPGELA
jgi:hypothetical protein